MSGLQYLTHAVDRQVYGVWYRIISPTEIEVVGVGLLEVVSYAGFSPESAARSVLENFVKMRDRMGLPIPSLTTAASVNQELAASSTGPEPARFRPHSAKAEIALDQVLAIEPSLTC